MHAWIRLRLIIPEGAPEGYALLVLNEECLIPVRESPRAGPGAWAAIDAYTSGMGSVTSCPDEESGAEMLREIAEQEGR